jgi:hypothetical protein
MHGELRISTLNNEPVDGMVILDSTYFTSVFPRRRHTFCQSSQANLELSGSRRLSFGDVCYQR